MAIIRLVSYRCRRAKRCYLVNFRDAKAAFPSLKHEAINNKMQKEQPELVAKLFGQLYKKAKLVLKLGGGKVRTWRMMRGTRQGDSTGSDVFCEIYDDSIEQCSNKRDRPMAVMTLNGEELDMSVVTFVDDIAEISIYGGSGSQVDDLEKQVAENTKLLVEELDKIGCSLEATKEEVVAGWQDHNWQAAHSGKILGGLVRCKWHE